MLPIITADERLAESNTIKGVIFGEAGVGKTSLLWTLDPEATLFFDLEAGDLAVQGWQGDSIRPRSWQECRDFACYIGGPNPAVTPEQPYSQMHYDAVCERYGDPAALDKYKTLFVDSITVATRLSLAWAQQQPESFSERSGKPDLRAAYGLHGREIIRWLTQLQHIRKLNVWMVGGLEYQEDEFKRGRWVPQMDGSKAARELPFIVDQVVTMAKITPEGGNPYRAFVCTTLNTQDVPGKDRSGRLGEIEEPNLGKLMDKIHGPRPHAPGQLETTIPEKETQ